MNHIMLDIETLSTRVDAVILAIGAVRFGENPRTFYRAVQPESQPGRRVDASTIAWWKEQSPEARYAAFNDPAAIPLAQALDEFRAWVGFDWEEVKVWANSPDFDCSIIRHAYGDQEPPWKFYNTRCLRTIRDCDAARMISKPPNPCAHDALNDAIAQAQHLQMLWAAGIGV